MRTNVRDEWEPRFGTTTDHLTVTSEKQFDGRYPVGTPVTDYSLVVRRPHKATIGDHVFDSPTTRYSFDKAGTYDVRHEYIDGELVLHWSPR